jgi:hypothetical protein
MERRFGSRLPLVLGCLTAAASWSSPAFVDT